MRSRIDVSESRIRAHAAWHEFLIPNSQFLIASVRRRLRGALEGDLLDRPRRAVALVDHRVRLAMQFVDETAGLAVAFAGLRPTDQVAVQIDLVDLAVAVTAEQELVRR